MTHPLWYVAHGDTAHLPDAVVWLARRGCDAYLPLRRVDTGHRRLKWRLKPLLGPYVFVPAQSDLDTLRSCKRIHGLLRAAGGHLAAIPHSEVDRIAELEREIAKPRPQQDSLRIGDLVQAIRGPWEYHTGQIVRLDAHGQVVIEIKSPARVLKFSMPALWLRPANHRGVGPGGGVTP